MPEAQSFLLVSDIITRAQGEAIGSTVSSIPAMEDAQMIEWVETLNAKLIDAAHTRHHNGGWSWMRRVQNFKTVADTTLDGAVAASVATFDVTDGSDLDASGRIAIETSQGAVEFVDYESISTNTLTTDTTTGAETVSMAHADGETVHKMYALPTDYAKTYSLLLNSTEYIPSKNALLIPVWRNYTQYGAYILLPSGIGVNDVSHYYYKKPSALTALTDTTEIPLRAERWAIEMTLLHVFRVRKKREDIALSLQLAEMELDALLQYDQSITVQSASQGIRTGFTR